MKSILCITFVFIIHFGFAQTRVSMNHYTTGNGLSNNTVRCILQDSKGFIWVGTDGGGLNKFDGYRFVVYENRGNDKQSLSNSQVNAIAEDKEGNIWVGTQNGLNKLDSKTGKFQRFYHDSTNTNTLNHNRISALLVDRDNNLWIGTNLGLLKYDIKNKVFTDYSAGITLQDGRKEKQVNCIADDGKGNLWLGIWWGGLKKFRIKDGSYTSYYAKPNNPAGLQNNNVLSVCIDNSGNLWTGNHSGGIRKFSIAAGRFKTLKNPENNLTIWSICNDKKGRICYTRSGIGFLNESGSSTRFLDYSKDEPEGISSGYHYVVYYDRTGILWLGSTEGLSMYSHENKRFSPFLHLIDKDKRFYITTFFKRNNESVIWLGTFGNGIIRLNEKTGKYDQFFTGNNNSPTLPDNYITTLFGDANGQIWAGSGNGIAVLDEQSGRVKKYLYHNRVKANLANSVLGNNGFMFVENDSVRIFDIRSSREYVFPVMGASALPGRTVTTVLQEGDSILWIGSNAGLARYSLKTRKIQFYSGPGKSNNSISGETIRSIIRDKIGNLWVGTQNGLNKYNSATNTFERIAEGEENMSINGISEDAKGYLWLLTEKGLTRYHPVSRQFRHYDEYDGLTSSNNLYRDSGGLFYCNRTREGYYRFHPDSMKDILQKPLVYINRFFLFNKEVLVSTGRKESPLKTDILSAKEIVLRYNQSVISFEFTALNYLLASKNRFYYKLEGFDEDWYQTDAMHRMATYTNLSAGQYTFMVKASNSDGVWSDKNAEIRIRILPPPWKTWWAYLIYIVILIASLVLFRRSVIQREKLRNRIKMDALEYERKIKMDEMKMRFFANISHEFRTPLTLILAPLHAILQLAVQRSDNQTAEHAGLIQRNARRLADLINQLLDLQKLEAHSLKPEICEGDVQDFVSTIAEKFIPLSEQKNIRYQITCSPQSINGWFDPDKTEKIITNLLSNAFKFTKDNVSLTVSREEDNICIRVEDNGKGIPSEQLERIFERFYHADDSPGRIQEGTGIGLSLVKEMTELLNGKIAVISEVGRFSCFILRLPLTQEAFPNHNLRNAPVLSTEKYLQMDFERNNMPPDGTKAKGNESLILIVEDNSDLRQYLKLVLMPDYRILEAADGKAGLLKAQEYIPDVIISDILMPEMDGIQMTQLLKNDTKTSHIPVILLTSLATLDNKLKGLETGADDYIVKPFNEEILLLKISNIIRQRNQMQRFFVSKYGLQSTGKFTPKEIVVESLDEIFLQKAVSIIEQHIDDPDFSNEILAKSLGLSVAVLYRKTNALINCTPADFVRDIKIKRAIQLLETGKLSVSEVATKVGFDDPHYFGKWFKKNLGKSPSELMPV